MKKLLSILFCLSQFISCSYAQFPVVTHAAINPVLHPTSRVLSTCYVDPHTIWFATIITPPTDTFCLGTTYPNLIDFFMTTPGVAYYKYYQHNVYTGANWGMNNFMPVSSDQYIPVDTGTYSMSLEIIHTGGDTCMSGEFGFQMVQVDPPYYCLPMSAMNTYPNPVVAPSFLNIQFNSAVAGSGTLIIQNLNTGQSQSAPFNPIRKGVNRTMLSTLYRPHGNYKIKIVMPRSGNVPAQVLFSTQIFIN